MSKWQFLLILLAINYGILTTYGGVEIVIKLTITLFPYNGNYAHLLDCIIVQGFCFLSHWFIKLHLSFGLNFNRSLLPMYCIGKSAIPYCFRWPYKHRWLSTLDWQCWKYHWYPRSPKSAGALLDKLGSHVYTKAYSLDHGACVCHDHWLWLKIRYRWFNFVITPTEENKYNVALCAICIFLDNDISLTTACNMFHSLMLCIWVLSSIISHAICW